MVTNDGEGVGATKQEGGASEVLPLQQVGCRQRFGHAEEGVGKKGFEVVLRLDNTGAWAFEVFPSLLCYRMIEHIDLYIKLKLVIFSFI